MPSWTIDLASKQALDPLLAGGKGAALAWLRRSGFRVPPGFVVTSAAFAALINGGSLAPAADAQQFLLTAPLPAPLLQAIRRAYGRLGGCVAVRSSMVGEDGGTASYAGQLESALNVMGEEAVIAAVRACWASAFGVRAAQYRARQGNNTNPPAVAVVVQRMVDAAAAGVAFSVDPLSGRRCVHIEAVGGLGDALMQGLVEPDRFVVDERGALADVRLCDAGRAALPTENVLALAQMVRNIARRRGEPQDVEWAWDGAALHILQTRPITTLAGQHVYSSSLVADMTPGLVKPLVFSINTVGKVQWVFSRMFTELIGPNDYDFSRLVRRIHSRVYADVTLLGELFERTGLPANFIEMMSHDEKAQIEHPRVSLRMLPALYRLGRFALRHGWPAAEIRGYLAEHAQRLAAFEQADWSQTGCADLLAALDRLMALHSGMFWYTFLGQITMMIRNQVLARWVRVRAPGVTPGDLIRGLIGIKALEANAELRRLAASAQQLPAAALVRLAAVGEEAAPSFLADTPVGRQLMDEVAAFLRRYGHLSSNNLDFSEPPWVENPALIWRAIGREAARPPEADAVDVALIRDRARRQARARLAWAERRMFDGLLKSTVAYIALREQLSARLSLDTYQLRRIVLGLARELAATGSLSRPQDIFFLTYAEIKDLAAGALIGAEAARLAAARRAEIAEDATVEPPVTVCGERVPVTPVRLAEGQRYLSGIPGSSGRVQGYARVVVNPTQAPAALGAADILIVPFTDVGWTPLFRGVSGIVAETGGQLCHTSIIAREYGLPAVVSVRQATQLITEGQPIPVDGDQGRVYLRHLEPA